MFDTALPQPSTAKAEKLDDSFFNPEPSTASSFGNWKYRLCPHSAFVLLAPVHAQIFIFWPQIAKLNIWQDCISAWQDTGKTGKSQCPCLSGAADQSETETDQMHLLQAKSLPHMICVLLLAECSTFIHNNFTPIATVQGVNCNTLQE